MKSKFALNPNPELSSGSIRKKFQSKYTTVASRAWSKQLQLSYKVAQHHWKKKSSRNSNEAEQSNYSIDVINYIVS